MSDGVETLEEMRDAAAAAAASTNNEAIQRAFNAIAKYADTVLEHVIDRRHREDTQPAAPVPAANDQQPS